MMIRTYSLALLCLSLLTAATFSFIPLPAYAETQQGFAVNYVRGEGELEGVKLAYQLYLDSLRSIHPDLELTLESSVNFWEYGKQHSHDTDFVLAASPILRYPLVYGRWFDTYLEGGIGIAFLDDKYFAGKNVGLHFQFEDRLGFAFRFGSDRDNTLSLTYLHYSNAGLSEHNPGLDLINLAYSRRF